jgi:purine-nucleoside phosphorylase
MSRIIPFPLLAELAQAEPPRVALILGSGLSQLARRLENAHSVPFLEVPGMPGATVAGHRGCLTLGDWAGQRVLVFEGRLHFYEGHPWRTVVLPVQTAAFLGVKILLLTNAAGGIRADLTPGRLMALTDHIEWTRPYCWRQPVPGALGPARPSPYGARVREVLLQAGETVGLNLAQGVYAQLTGPTYETPAEIRALQAWGADAVGMSTAREAQAAVAAGLECAALSLITNQAAGLSAGPIHHGEVLTTADAARDRFADLLESFLSLV